jgi:hypothetical protein
MIGILFRLHAFILGPDALWVFLSSSPMAFATRFLVAAYSKPIAGSMLLSLKPSLEERKYVNQLALPCPALLATAVPH